MDWFVISILCAFSLATADAYTKRHLAGYSGWALLLIRFVVPGALLTPLLFLYPIPAVPVEFWAWLVLLVPLEMLAMLFYMQAIRDAPLYQTIPYLAFTPVFNILTGWVILDEKVSLIGAAGIVLIVMGTYLLNIDKVNQYGRRQWLEPIKAIAYQRGSRRMLLVASIYSVTSVAGKAAMTYVGPMSFGAFYFCLLGLATFLVVSLARPTELRVFQRNLIPHIIVGCLMALMIVTHFFALSMVEAAYMIAVKRVSLLFGFIYGAYWFHEQGLRHNLSSVLLMVIGVALILFA